VYVSRSKSFGSGKNGIFAHRGCDGEVMDHFEADDNCWGSAVAANGAVFFGCNDKFRAVKVNTHIEKECKDHFASKASHVLNEPVSSNPILSTSGEAIFVSTDVGNLRALRIPAEGELGESEASFDVLWLHGPQVSNEPPGPTSSPVLSPDGTLIYYVTFKATVFCLNSSTGAVIWNSKKVNKPRINLGKGPVVASPITSHDGSTVFIGSTAGFGAFHADTGAKKWFVRGASDIIGGSSSGSSGSGHGYELTTAVMNLPEHDDIVFVGSSNYNLYALHAETGEPITDHKDANHKQTHFLGADTHYFRTNDDVRGTPVHHPFEPVVYFGGNDRQLRALK
jgi:outer membrane protein assembly factor BamB